MNSLKAQDFARLLTEGVYRLRLIENKKLQIVQDELGYATGRKGGAVIRYWRGGHLPPKLVDVETLAREIVRRGRMERGWLEQFLQSADHPNATALCDELTPLPAEAASISAPIPEQTSLTLPRPLTSLLGREQSLASARQILSHPDIRLLTLTGAPGVGKTRLALQLAAEARPAFSGRVVFVSLAPLHDPNQVSQVIARTLGLSREDRSILETLSAFLRAQPCLLVLDNFEHLIPAAPQVAALLAAAASLKVVVTSREPLRLYGEHQFPVPPLALPEAGDEAMFSSPAVQLFVERAQAVDPAFQITSSNIAAIVELCTRLDGLPLAIELVAARIKLLSPEAIVAQRLALEIQGPRDAPLRQQTLRNALDWSYQLLSPAEQTLFACLSVFVGSYTIEAANAVCGLSNEHAGSWPQAEALESLKSLADKNLVQYARPPSPNEAPRFMMLETLREYARQKLAERDETDTISRRHLDWFLQLSEQAAKGLHGPQQIPWLNRLEQDLDNLRAALAWCLAHPIEIESGLRIGAALLWFWQIRSLFYEGQDWLDRLLAVKIDSPPSFALRRAQAKALYAAGFLNSFHTQPAKGVDLTQASLALFRELGDKQGTALALTNLGIFAFNKGDFVKAAALAKEALVLFQEDNDAYGIARVLNNLLGQLAFEQKDYARAAVLQEAALAIRQRLGDNNGIAWSFFLLAQVAQAQGDIGRAQQYYAESRTLWHQLGNFHWSTIALSELGKLALRQGDSQQAKTFFDESLAAAEKLGEKQSPVSALYRSGDGSLEEGEAESSDTLSQAPASAEESLHLHPALKDKPDAGVALLHLGQIARHAGEYERAKDYLKQAALLIDDDYQSLQPIYLIEAAGLAWATHQPERAARLGGALQTLLQMRQERLDFIHQAEYEQVISAVRTSIDEDVFNQAWDDGQTMTLPEAIMYAQET